MCKLMEDMRNETARKTARETAKNDARRLLKLGKIKADEIAECFPDLSDGDVKELETEIRQLA